jgi:hypothetical protein
LSPQLQSPSPPKLPRSSSNSRFAAGTVPCHIRCHCFPTPTLYALAPLPMSHNPSSPLAFAPFRSTPLALPMPHNPSLSSLGASSLPIHPQCLTSIALPLSPIPRTRSTTLPRPLL